MKTCTTHHICECKYEEMLQLQEDVDALKEKVEIYERQGARDRLEHAAKIERKLHRACNYLKAILVTREEQEPGSGKSIQTLIQELEAPLEEK